MKPYSPVLLYTAKVRMQPIEDGIITDSHDADEIRLNMKALDKINECFHSIILKTVFKASNFEKDRKREITFGPNELKEFVYYTPVNMPTIKEDGLKEFNTFLIFAFDLLRIEEESPRTNFNQLASSINKTLFTLDPKENNQLTINYSDGRFITLANKISKLMDDLSKMNYKVFPKIKIADFSPHTIFPIEKNSQREYFYNAKPTIENVTIHDATGLGNKEKFIVRLHNKKTALHLININRNQARKLRSSINNVDHIKIKVFAILKNTRGIISKTKKYALIEIVEVLEKNSQLRIRNQNVKERRK